MHNPLDLSLVNSPVMSLSFTFCNLNSFTINFHEQKIVTFYRFYVA